MTSSNLESQSRSLPRSQRGPILTPLQHLAESSLGLTQGPKPLAGERISQACKSLALYKVADAVFANETQYHCVYLNLEIFIIMVKFAL